ncbi:hypothetical protein CRG98_028747 [Punica granatum]|uniref:Uncharacterized protein n=1 Tax=Punica granatum TaxID=22663 RepID=A0A2I0J4K3_PUNGR|nr:hypothetical protein CRG98_028747 [Punica granatum]
MERERGEEYTKGSIRFAHQSREEEDVTSPYIALPWKISSVPSPSAASRKLTSFLPHPSFSDLIPCLASPGGGRPAVNLCHAGAEDVYQIQESSGYVLLGRMQHSLEASRSTYALFWSVSSVE